MSKVKLLWKAPSVALAQRGPRVLEFLNREGKTEFFAPEMDESGNIIYEVSEDYGRRLLAGQADRFFLLSPAKIIVKQRRKDNMGAEYVTVKAITGFNTPAPAPAQGGAEGSDGTPAPAQVPETGLDGALPAGEAQAAPETAAPNPEAGKTVQKGGPAANPEKHKPDRPKATA